MRISPQRPLLIISSDLSCMRIVLRISRDISGQAYPIRSIHSTTVANSETFKLGTLLSISSNTGNSNDARSPSSRYAMVRLARFEKIDSLYGICDLIKRDTIFEPSSLTMYRSPAFLSSHPDNTFCRINSGSAT